MENMSQDDQGRWYVPRKPRPGSEALALGEGGGYDDEDLWILSDDDPPDDD